MICAIQCKGKFRGRNRHFLAPAFDTLGAATCTVFSRRLAQTCSPHRATANRTKTLGRPNSTAAVKSGRLAHPRPHTP